MKSAFPDLDSKPDSGNISSGPEKSGIGKPELAIPISLDQPVNAIFEYPDQSSHVAVKDFL